MGGGNKLAKSPRFKLITSIQAADEKEEALKGYHAAWRNNNTHSGATFVPLFTSFKESHLATIEPSALRLYLYFLYAANNQNGDSWHSIESIAKFFGTQTRTVNNWIKILVDKNLIYREQKDKRSYTTYLIPYSTTVIRHQPKKEFEEDNQNLFDLFIEKINHYEFLYGSIVGAFHIFQWKTDRKNKPIKKGSQRLCIITKRSDGVLTGHYYQLKKSDSLGVSELEIKGSDVSIFTSPFMYKNHNIKGLALTHEIKLSNSNTGSFIKLIEDLAKIETSDWDEHPKVEYGDISKFFPENDDQKEEEASNKEEE